MIEPDTKDWTWVLRRPCPDCGYDAEAVARGDLGSLIRDDAAGWSVVLATPGVRERPDRRTWSALEYACHVRDVHRVMVERLALMLEQDEPIFANWDQDATARDDDYPQQDPATVVTELFAAAGEVAAAYDALADAPGATWSRRGLRSNGSEFTVDTLARYHLHDLVHHAHDVRRLAATATVSAYDADAGGYAEAALRLVEPVRPRLAHFAEAVGLPGEVLEIGSAGGRDAAVLEELGLRVRRTDISSGFVDLLRAAGHEATVLDPRTDDLGGPHAGGPYDGVWANACLLHVPRPDLAVVLRRLAAATRPAGVLGLSLKEGDGEAWSTHGRVTAPRRFVYWREEALRVVLDESDWEVESLTVETSPSDEQAWLLVVARRRDHRTR